jgi:homoserine kinase type II
MTLAEVLGNWDVVPNRVRLIKGGDGNAHWSVSAGRQRYVLRRYGSHRNLAQVRWEHQLLAAVAALGWPVACAIGAPVTIDDRIYCLFPFMGGSPMRGLDDQQRRRCGRMLAEFHLDVASLEIDARPGEPKVFEFTPSAVLEHRDAFRSALGDTDGELFAERALSVADDFERLHVREFPRSITHGDLSPWNVRFRDSQLSALFDLDHSDVDVRAADVACGRRGYHDDFVEGYLSVFQLSGEELAGLGPLWSAQMLSYADNLIADGITTQEWNLPELQWCRTQLTKTLPFTSA